MHDAKETGALACTVKLSRSNKVGKFQKKLWYCVGGGV